MSDQHGGGDHHEDRILDDGEEAELSTGVRIIRSDDGEDFMLERESRASEVSDNDYVVLSRIEVAALAEMAGYDPKEVEQHE